MTSKQTTHRSEQGFTLVELAIVMVIIGLLIGGILKGQELIANAKVTATVSQVKSVDAALNTFFDKYNAYPGTMLNPGGRLPNCTATGGCATAGDGDSFIENSTTAAGDVDAPPAAEELTAFVHLNAADLVSGINPSVAGFGGALPTVKAGGGMWIGHAGGTAVPFGTLHPAGRHYAVLAGSPLQVADATGALNAVMAAQIDRKLDDGLPNAGSVQSAGDGTCETAATAAGLYAENQAGGTCTLFIRVLN